MYIGMHTAEQITAREHCLDVGDKIRSNGTDQLAFFGGGVWRKKMHERQTALYQKLQKTIKEKKMEKIAKKL
jgi:hypothetical protein